MKIFRLLAKVALATTAAITLTIHAGPSVAATLDDGIADSRDALTADFGPYPPSAARGDGQYMELQGRGKGGGVSTVLNANARIALARVDYDGNVLVRYNGHLGVNEVNFDDAAVTLFIGTDEDGDGTLLQESPHAICALLGAGEPEVNEDYILHVAYKLALRLQGKRLKGDGTCWTNFDDVTVTPLYEGDVFVGVAFDVYGGQMGMPDIKDGDVSMVGFDAPWIFNTECGMDESCAVVPFLATDGAGGEPWHD